MATSKRTHHRKPAFMNNMMDDIFHPDQPICQIIPTNVHKKHNIFTEYRPQPKTCLDYNISQTDTKIDAGETKIHYQQTIAEYYPALSEPPPPPPPKKRKYFDGGPPHWVFIDEIWRRKEEKMQQQHLKVFTEYVKRTRNNNRHEMLDNHFKALAKVGPAWFQELSPLQLVTVDNLKKCIQKDLAEETIINTQENIASLGLVLRPNHNHIKKALKNCCKCPVEFLLILYQLINPTRVKYSINDRLLLSAVVHLTMQETLKELHIRIPSPPRPPKDLVKIPKLKKKRKYASPYLIPFTFVRKPSRFSGIYYNKHLQHPQSPYFCYLKDLRKMQRQINEVDNNRLTNSIRNAFSNDKDEDIENELTAAQLIYENLVEFKPVPKLLKPSKHYVCDNFRNREPSDFSIEEVEEEKNLERVQDDSPCYLEYVQPCCEPEISEQFDGGCTCPPKSTCPCSVQVKACVDESVQFAPKNISSSCWKPTKSVKVNEITCQEDNDGTKSSQQKNSLNNSANYTVASTRSQCGTVIAKPEIVSEKDEIKQTCKHAEGLALFDWYCEYKNRATEDKKSCRCKKKYKDLVEKPFCQCEKCQEERKMKAAIFGIQGMKETEEGVIPIIDGVTQEKPCKCLSKYQERIKCFEKEAKILCRCRKEAQKLIETPFCQCERCKEDRKQKEAKYIIGGIKESVSENKIPIIEGISKERPCRCLKEYEDKADAYQEFQERKKLVCSLKEQQDKFMIGGIVNTPEGPVYVITGMRPPIDCVCAKNARKEEEEKRMEAIMPHAPAGRIRYNIVGVKETPAGNMYILDSALPIEECDCMAVYKKFEDEHYQCITLYEKYLAQMKDVYNDFMKDMLPPTSSRRSSMASSAFRENIENETDDTVANEDAVEEKTEEQTVEKTQLKEEPELAIFKKSLEPCDQQLKLCQSCMVKSYSNVCCDCNKLDCNDCTCGKIIECVDCTCGPEEVEEEPEVKEEITLKRFFIFQKILCNRKWQKNVIKKALESMAEDGYPLAKLPECYKLPHFKLWMQMRCGTFWTQADRYKYIFNSKQQWRHCDVCNVRNSSFPKLPVTVQEANKMNWSQAAYIRKMVNGLLEKFYRNEKQQRVNFGREFFPTTYSYEFPFRTWRDCYFAYTPTKEEDVLAQKVWQKYEYKNYADMQRFCG